MIQQLKHCRHSRERGNPETDLDPRIRGDDDHFRGDDEFNELPNIGANNAQSIGL